MVGLLRWRESRGLPRPGRIEEVRILGLRFLSLELPLGRRSPAAVRAWRLRRGAERLSRRGVRRVLLPPGAEAACLPAGMAAADTLALRRGLASEWAGALLRRSGPGSSADVLVTAEALTPAVVQGVTALSLRQRHLMLSLPYGGEDLARRLRREYGVSLLLSPTAAQKDQAALHLAFSPTAPQGGGLFLPVYDPSLPLPDLLLPQEIAAQLPEDLDRPGLLSLLWEAGRLRPGQVTVCLEDASPA